jgi:TPR repeat protein
MATPFISAAGAQSFFNTFGTAEKKYHHVGKPTIGYIGYVRMQSDTEYVVLVNTSGATTYVTSFVPPKPFENDLLSLVAKKDFLDSIVDAMGEAERTSTHDKTRQSDYPARESAVSEQTPSSEDLAWIIRRAKIGDAEAQYELAKSHMSGNGVRKSSRRAFDWCLRAAHQKQDPGAMYDVAEMYRLGNGTAKDWAEAFKWYEATANWGHHPEAANRVGIMYRDGQGVSRDLEMARDWFLSAATNGSRDALFNLGMMCAAGEGGPQDYREAISWIMPAEDGGHAAAQRYLGYLAQFYQAGSSVPQGQHEAFEWFIRAAEHGHEKARRLLGHP